MPSTSELQDDLKFLRESFDISVSQSRAWFKKAMERGKEVEKLKEEFKRLREERDSFEKLYCAANRHPASPPACEGERVVSLARQLVMSYRYGAWHVCSDRELREKYIEPILRRHFPEPVAKPNLIITKRTTSPPLKVDAEETRDWPCEPAAPDAQPAETWQTLRRKLGESIQRAEQAERERDEAKGLLGTWLMAYDSGCCTDRHITPQAAERTLAFLQGERRDAEA